jgi:hypothetical protein
VLVSSLVDRGFISGVMVSALASSLVDRGLTGGVMVSVLGSSLVERGFLSGVMVRGARLESGRSWVHWWCNG